MEGDLAIHTHARLASLAQQYMSLPEYHSQFTLTRGLRQEPIAEGETWITSQFTLTRGLRRSVANIFGIPANSQFTLTRGLRRMV